MERTLPVSVLACTWTCWDKSVPVLCEGGFNIEKELSGVLFTSSYFKIGNGINVNQ